MVSILLPISFNNAIEGTQNAGNFSQNYFEFGQIIYFVSTRLRYASAGIFTVYKVYGMSNIVLNRGEKYLSCAQDNAK